MSEAAAELTLHSVIKNKESISHRISEIISDALEQIESLDVDVEVLTEPGDASQDRTKDR